MTDRMNKKKSRRQTWRTAFIDTLPILTAYLILGMGFGVLSVKAGISVWLVSLMSIAIFAGSMQYVAVPLIAGEASVGSVILITLLVNARHIFYGLSMLERYANVGKVKPYLIFGLTDETYSLVSRKSAQETDAAYALAVTSLNHAYWIIGSTLGAILGTTLQFNSTGIEFSMTALFVVIFIEQWQQHEHHLPALIGLVGTAVARIFFGTEHFLIAAMVFILLALLTLPAIRPEYKITEDGGHE